MNWIIENLPLDDISDFLSQIIIWWSHLVQDVPAAQLPLYAYVGGAVLVLVLWLFVMRILPRPISGISWMVLFAVLMTPTTALGDTGEIAPASIAVVYSVLMKDYGMALSHLLPILVVMIAGLFLGFIWQLIRSAIESMLERSRQSA